MFELTKEELKNWRSQFATSNQDIMGLRIPPFAFTEHGVVMFTPLNAQPIQPGRSLFNRGRLNK